jgi:guanylate kinase
LKYRGTDSSDIIEKRLINAIEEMNQIDKYNYLVINDNFETALQQLTLIVTLISEDININKTKLDNFIKNWK